MTKKILKITIISGLVFLASFAFADNLVGENSTEIMPPLPPTEQVFCSADAKKCDDGTYVSRQGPKCEFAKCPKKKEVSEKEEKNEISFCTKEYMPVCAAVDTGVRCIKEPCPSTIEKTFANNCMAKNAGAKFLYNGPCDSSGDSFEGIPDGLSEDGDGTDEKLAEKQKIRIGQNPEQDRMKYEKSKLFLLLEQAKDENERKKILQDNKKMKLVATSTSAQTVVLENKILKKRKEVLDKKSNEIFSKFDFFISKIESVSGKILLKNSKIKNTEVSEILVRSEKSLTEANRLKAEAWIVFSEIADVETKNIAEKKILKVKKLLKESKENISVSFVLIKQAIGILKK